MKFYTPIAIAISLTAVTNAAATSNQVTGKFPGYPGCREIVRDEIYDCGNSSDLIHVQEVTFHPRPEPGHSSTMTIIGKTKKGLDKSSKGNLSIKHDHEIVHDEEYEVCDKDDDHHPDKRTCPREAGQEVRLVKEFYFKPHEHNHNGEYDLEDLAHNGYNEHERKILYHIKARF